MALATRALALGGRTGDGGVESTPLVAEPDPATLFRIVERVIDEGGEREGTLSADLGPGDARALLESWLAAMELDLRGRELIDHLQSDDFSHAELYRRARRIHGRRLQAAVESGVEAVKSGGEGRDRAMLGAAADLFGAIVPAVPYAPAAAFLGREKAKLAAVREAELPRVAIVADGIGAMHGVTRTVEQIRERGVPGFEVEVVGTDRNVDRRLPAVAELDVPFYEGLALGVPALPEFVETLAEGRYDLIHVTAPGPIGVSAALLARAAGVPLVASYHTELAAYAGMRSGDETVEALARAGVGVFYRAASVVLSPSASADSSLAGLGAERRRIGRWGRGVDVTRFGPERADRGAYPGEIKVLYAGRLTREKGVDLLAESFLRAHRFDPRLHLLLAGGGAEEDELRERLGEAATFLGWLGEEDLARAYASADLFLFCSRTDTYGQVIVEAGASGLPVVAVGEGGPASLVENRITGLLAQADADRLAGAVLQLSASPELRRRLGASARAAAQERSWERSLEQLGAGYRCALAAPANMKGTARAA
jgi:glycosyltransferase involved in cell wall biosynthesis